MAALAAALAEMVRAGGGPALGVAAFVGATLVPVSSEVAFGAALWSGLPTAAALAWATVGNTLGCALNYGLGRWGRARFEPRLLASRSGRAALRWTERWGLGALALSWLPIVGDPLTLAAGVARVRPALFFPVVAALRLARYAAIAWALG